MPPTKSRKRKHSELEADNESEYDEQSTSPSASRSHKRRKTGHKPQAKRSVTKTRKKKSAIAREPEQNGNSDSENESVVRSHKKQKSASKSPSSKKQSKPTTKSKKSKSSQTKTTKTSKEERESDEPEEEADENSSEFDPESVPARKNMKRTRISTARPSSQRMSVSQSSPRRQTQHADDDNEDDDDDDEDDDSTQYRLVTHNERVREMYEWLTSSTSWSDIKKTLDVWIDNESQCDDTENYAELTLDVVNLILYCGGVRVFKLDDIEDLDLDTLDKTETKALVRSISNALQVHHSDVAGAEEENEKVLEQDALLWCNGTKTAQRSFESRYRQLLGHIGAALKQPIFDGDDWIVSIIFKWCKFLARRFRLSHVRRLGTFTAFCLCAPLVAAMSGQRKPMGKLEDQLQRRELELERKQNKNKSKTKTKKKSSQSQSPSPSKTKNSKSEKLSSLEKNIDEFSTRIANLQSHVTFVFMQIAVFKASDTHELIRCMVLQHLVKWINTDASVDSFLNQKHWQYLLYGLQDRQSPKVRCTALECLMDLFDFEQKFHGSKASSKKTSPKRNTKKKKVGGKHAEEEAIVAEREQDKLDETRKRILEPLWDRMSSTVNELLRDRDETVVKKCIEFVNILLRGDVLGPDDGDCILNYVFDENDDIRTMAAQFIYYDTFDNQAVLKSQASSSDAVRIKHEAKLKDDVVELIQLIKDRVISLNWKVKRLLHAERTRIQKQLQQQKDEEAADEEEDGVPPSQQQPPPQATVNAMKSSALYRNYVQVSDYIVQSMGDQLGVLREWSVLCTMLIDADHAEQRRQERSVTQQSRSSSGEAAAGDDGDAQMIEDMSVKQDIDEEGQTILCYLLLSCVRRATDCLSQHVRNVKSVRGRQKLSTSKQEKQDALDRLKQQIVPFLARLLDIYQADVFKLYPLVQIIPLIPADAFNGVAQKEHLLRIGDSLKTIFLRHDTPLVRQPQPAAEEDGDDAEDEEEEEQPDKSQMSEEEIESLEDRIRVRELKKLKRCVKREIDERLVQVVGAALTYFCTHEHEQKECCTRLLHDIVTHVSGEFERVTDAVDVRLTKGHDFSTLPALLHDDDHEEETEDVTSKLDLMQSLYSNLQRQYALKSSMTIGALQWTESMQSLLGNILDSFLFAGAHFEIASVLQQLLCSDIAHQVVHKLSHSSPDLERLALVRNEKATLVKVLHFFVRATDEQKHTLSCTGLLACLDSIVSMLDTLTFFRQMHAQSSLLDEVFNNARLSDWIPPSQEQVEHAAAATTDIGEQVKQRLLRVCRFVWSLPCIEDPFDPSAHTVTENVQIRFLMGAARLCLLEPTYYRSFGALILLCWHERSVRYALRLKPKEERVDVRRKELTKKIAGQLHKHCHAALEEMLFEATRMIVLQEQEQDTDVSVRKKHVEELCRSVFMLEGLTRNRKVWMQFIEKFLSFVLSEPQHIPSHFVYLHALTYVFSHLTNRDKLEIWSVFQSLSRRLPEQHIREQQDEGQWQLYHTFGAKLKKHALQASEKRRLDYNEADIENYDLTQSQAAAVAAPPAHVQQQEQEAESQENENGNENENENKDADEDDGENAQNVAVPAESEARDEAKVDVDVDLDVDMDMDVNVNEEQQEIQAEQEEEEEEGGDEVVQEEPPTSVTLQRISVSRPTKKRRGNVKSSDDGMDEESEENEEEEEEVEESNEESESETSAKKKEKKRKKRKEKEDKTESEGDKTEKRKKKGKWLKKKKKK